MRGGWGMYYQVPNVAYFGNSSAPNSAATGINENIGGPSPVLQLSNQTPITFQAGVPIFATLCDWALMADSPSASNSSPATA